MKRRTAFNITLGVVMLALGCGLVIVGLSNPASGGCITYSNGSKQCAQSPNLILLVPGIVLVIIGTVEVIYGIRSNLGATGQNEPFQGPTVQTKIK
jgi:hypothetical protein